MRVDERSKTFISKRGLVPDTSFGLKIDDREIIAARIYVAKHSQSIEEMLEFLEMLGL